MSPPDRVSPPPGKGGGPATTRTATVVAEDSPSPRPDGSTSVDTAEQMRGYAVQLATKRAFAVFPADHPAAPRCRGIKTRDHNPDKCDDRGKHPTCRWSEWSTTAVEQLATPRYFGGGEPRNIGVDCGKSRLLVIDEGAANGCPIPDDSALLQRDDGRGVYVFAVPDTWRRAAA